MKNNKTRKRIKIAALSLITLGLIGFISFNIYVSDYYRASSEVHLGEYSKLGAFVSYDDEVGAYVISRNPMSNYADVDASGFILYPGGKVDEKAYIPLAVKVFEKTGAEVYIASMPYKLAVLDGDKASRVIGKYGNGKKDWYIGGHSLGGVFAGEFARKNPNLIKGVVYLGSYPLNDMSKLRDTRIELIRGSMDGVLDIGAYEKSKSLMKGGYSEKIINGGNHCYFGNYGIQKGDSGGKITRDAQQSETATYIKDFMDASKVE